MTDDSEKGVGVTGFYDRASLIWLSLVIDSLRRATYFSEHLQTYWQRLSPQDRVEYWYGATSALRTAESAARAICHQQSGLEALLEERLAAALKERKDTGDTPGARIRWLFRKGEIIQNAMMESGILVEPKPLSSGELYEQMQRTIFEASVPIYTDEEKKTLPEEELKELIGERLPEILGYEEEQSPEPSESANPDENSPSDDSDSGSQGGDA